MQVENGSFAQKLAEVRQESKQDILDTSAKYQAVLDSKHALEAQKELRDLLTKSSAAFIEDKPLLSKVSYL
jgi:hypothetical protein